MSYNKKFVVLFYFRIFALQKLNLLYMKRFVFLSMIVLCTVGSTKAQDIVNLRMDRGQMGLRGNVATMDEDILLRKDYFREDWPQRKWFRNDLRNLLREDNGSIVAFNPAGRMTSITYTHQGKAGKTTKCSYASNGLLSSFLGEGYKVEAKYHANIADINVYAETPTYSRSINLAKANLNTTPYTNTYPFDLKCRQELGDGGMVLNSRYYYVDSMPAKVCEYSYNHLDLLTDERITDYTADMTGVVTKIHYQYDNRGFLSQKTIHSTAVDETYSYVNNDKGDCTQMTIERPYGTAVYTFEYEYDTMGNWTMRLQFLDGVFDNAALRTLTYHKAPKAVDPAKVAAEAEKQAAKEAAAAEKNAAKLAKEQKEAEAKAAKEREAAMLKSMTAEERKAYKEQQAAAQKAAKEQQAAAAKAEKERVAAAQKAEKEQYIAVKKAEKERIAAEKKAKKEQQAAAKQAEKERKAAEKAAAKTK